VADHAAGALLIRFSFALLAFGHSATASARAACACAEDDSLFFVSPAKHQRASPNSTGAMASIAIVHLRFSIDANC